MQLHEIQTSIKKTKQRIGRGGKRSTFSGRGTKGQKARSGRRIRPMFRDILKKLPKKRGYRFNSFRQQPEVLNLSMLEMHFASGETVTISALRQKGMIKDREDRNSYVKILGTGELTKKITVEGCDVSKTAQTKIEKQGGSISPASPKEK